MCGFGIEGPHTFRRIVLTNHPPAYSANLTLGRNGAWRTIMTGISTNGRLAYVINADDAGRHHLTIHRPLLGWSKTAPLWRTIKRQSADDLPALLADIDPTIRPLMMHAAA